MNNEVQNKLKILILVIFFHCFNTQSQELSSVANARTFEQQNESLVHKSLAYACLNSTQVLDDLPCSAHTLYKVSDPKLMFQGYLSNGYNTTSKIYKLFSNDLNQETVDTLFSDQPVLQTEAFFSMIFLSKKFAAKFTPAGFNYYSVTRNQANPEIELKAVTFEQLELQVAHQINQFSFGLEVESTHWKVIKNNFYLFNILTDEGKNILKPEEQTTLFFQPSVGYLINLAWPVNLNLKYANAGYQSKQIENFKHFSELQFGAGIDIPVAHGNFNLLLDYKSLDPEASEKEKYHFGVQYKFGSMGIQGGLDAYGESLGVYYSLNMINAGIIFTSTQLPTESKETYAQTVAVQLGWQL